MQVSTLDPSSLTTAPTAEQLDTFVAALFAHEAAGHGVELRMRHLFPVGLYVREMFIPAGTVLAGARHKTEHVVSFDGDIAVWHEGSMVRLTGHHTLISSPGAKRVGYAVADTWCTGYFPNPDNERDVRVLEERFVEDAHLLQCNRCAVLTTEEIACLA